MFDEARIAATLQHANIVQVNDIELDTTGQVKRGIRRNLLK
jgi:hypothetical protein